MGGLIGNNGAVIISGIEKTWGEFPELGNEHTVEALSCSLGLQKEVVSSNALNRTRAPRTTVEVNASRTGSLPVEVKPASGFETLLRAGCKYYSTGTADSWSTDLDGAVVKGATSITLTDGTGILANDIVQIGSGTTSECAKITDITASPTFTIERPLAYAHSDAEATIEVIAPFTHNFIFDTNADLESFSLDKYLGTAFGERFKGVRVNSIEMSSAIGEMISGSFDLIGKEQEKIDDDTDGSDVLVDSGTTDSTVAGSLVDSTQNFETTLPTPTTINYLVKNTTDNTWSYVTSVTNDTTLVLENDIMVSGDAYEIYSSPFMLSATDIDALASSVDEPYTFANGTITEGGSDFGCVTSFNLNVNNNLDAGKCLGSGDNLGRLTALRGEITFGFDLEYYDDTVFDKYQDGTTLDILLTLSHDTSPYSITIDIPQLRLTEMPMELTDGVLSSSLNGIAEYSTSDSYHFKISSINNTYTA